MSRRLRRFLFALLLGAVSWIAYYVWALDWAAMVADAGGVVRAVIIFCYQFIRFPDVVGDVIHPLVDSVPVLAALILAGLAFACVREIVAETELRTPSRVLTALMVLLLLAVGLSDPPRLETRYVSFLYPLAVLLIVTAVAELAVRIRSFSAGVDYLAAAIVLGLFFATEDIDFKHVLTIDSPETTFRVGMKQEQQAHLIIRDDVRTIAEWLKSRPNADRSIVINGVHGFDYYFRTPATFSSNSTHSNFFDWSCRQGTVDRWTNLPLIYSFDDLKAKTKGIETTYVVMFTPTPAEMQVLADRAARIVMTKGLVTVIELEEVRHGTKLTDGAYPSDRQFERLEHLCST